MKRCRTQLNLFYANIDESIYKNSTQVVVCDDGIVITSYKKLFCICKSLINTICIDVLHQQQILEYILSYTNKMTMIIVSCHWPFSRIQQLV